MKKIFLLLPVLALCACDNAKTYVIGDTAECSGLNETDTEPVSCRDKNGELIKRGIVKQYYENGKIWREISIRDGRENGIEREYYENGNIHVIANVVDGRADGESKLFDENGKLNMIIDWKNNEVKSIKVYDENGEVVHSTSSEK